MDIYLISLDVHIQTIIKVFFLNSAFSGSFYGDTLGGTFSTGTSSSGFAKGFNFDASRSSSVYQNGQTQVVPAAVCIKFYIKY